MFKIQGDIFKDWIRIKKYKDSQFRIVVFVVNNTFDYNYDTEKEMDDEYDKIQSQLGLL